MDKEASPEQGDSMGFGWALAAMRNGEAVRRRVWGQLGDVTSREYARVELMQLPEWDDVIFVATTHAGLKTVFEPTVHQVLATDWEWV